MKSISLTLVENLTCLFNMVSGNPYGCAADILIGRAFIETPTSDLHNQAWKDTFISQHCRASWHASKGLLAASS